MVASIAQNYYGYDTRNEDSEVVLTTINATSGAATCSGGRIPTIISSILSFPATWKSAFPAGFSRQILPGHWGRRRTVFLRLGRLYQCAFNAWFTTRAPKPTSAHSWVISAKTSGPPSSWMPPPTRLRAAVPPSREARFTSSLNQRPDGTLHAVQGRRNRVPS